MHSVRFEIEEIIQKIRGGSAQTELGKCEESALQGCDVANSVRQDQRNKDQHVLEPLMRS